LGGGTFKGKGGFKTRGREKKVKQRGPGLKAGIPIQKK